MPSKKLQFKNADQHYLSARLELPVSGSPKAFALFAHCFTCTQHIKAASHISRTLAEEKIAVLRFDFAGLGESEGDFSDTNFSSNVNDLLAAADFLKARYSAPVLLIGHSLGGAAVLQAASKVPSARAVVTIGTPANPAHLKHLIADKKSEIEQHGEADVVIDGRRFKIKKQFLDDLDSTKMAEAIKTLKKALLVMHSPTDNTVGIENAGNIFTIARHPKSFISLGDADHLLMEKKDAAYAGRIIAAWADRYLPSRKTPY